MRHLTRKVDTTTDITKVDACRQGAKSAEPGEFTPQRPHFMGNPTAFVVTSTDYGASGPISMHHRKMPNFHG